MAADTYMPGSSECCCIHLKLRSEVRRTVLVSQIDVCAGLAQHLGDLQVAQGGREVQRTAHTAHCL